MKRILYLISFILLISNTTHAQNKISNPEKHFSKAVALIKKQKKLGKAHRILNRLTKKADKKKETNPEYAFYALYTSYKGKGNEKQAKMYFTYFKKSLPFSFEAQKQIKPEEIAAAFYQHHYQFTVSDYYFIETWAENKFNKKLTTDDVIAAIDHAVKFQGKKQNLVSLNEYYEFMISRISKDYKNIPTKALNQKAIEIFLQYIHKYPYVMGLKDIIEKHK